jgi:hypothetical protein
MSGRSESRVVDVARRLLGGGLAALAILAGATDVFAQQQQPQPPSPPHVQGNGKDFGGVYDLQGRNPDGTPYDGTLEIIQSGTVAVLTWRIGREVHVGTGVASSRSIAAAYGPVLVLFEQTGNGQLTGVWTVQGQGRLGYEIVKRRADDN